ncbi:uncharacterized protein LOC132277741 [Cornus florida]|uniref:uncharacterized protein LOC132277741 n=1 Tax=Cornus florida TaxID=4283 RepID=UPI00289D9C5D|nr:uncharacterized protein LOC132277741 [Cornus florida]
MLEHIPRKENRIADVLANLATTLALIDEDLVDVPIVFQEKICLARGTIGGVTELARKEDGQLENRKQDGDQRTGSRIGDGYSWSSDRAPGPDGFIARFFQHYWIIVGEDFTDVILQIFKQPVLGRGTNNTFITLIQKKKDAITVGDFRPISLCNTFYKVIAKILANRLSKVLGRIVGSEQIAFIQNRRIQDNIIGFGDQWIAWIKECMMDLEVRNGIVVPLVAAVKAGIPITHQFFADDLLLVVRANMASILTVKRLLIQFEKTSGLAVNKDKSEVFLTKSVRRRDAIVRSLGCKVGKLPFTYLGLLISDKLLGRVEYLNLVDKVIAVTSRWNGLNISMAGRVELSRAVIIPMVQYWTSVFSLPAAVSNLIERKMRNFVWGHLENRKKLHGLRWKNLTMPKEEGGYYNSLLSKDRIWVAWFQHCYLRTSSFWNVVPRINSSAMWRSLLAVRDVVKENCRYRIGDGLNVKVFLDLWCEGKMLSDLFNHRLLRCLSRNKNISMHELIIEGEGDVSQLNNTSHELIQMFQNQKIHGEVDEIQWVTTFSFKAAWEATRFRLQELNWAGLCWSGGRPRWSVHAVLQAVLNSPGIADDILLFSLATPNQFKSFTMVCVFSLSFLGFALIIPRVLLSFMGFILMTKLLYSISFLRNWYPPSYARGLRHLQDLSARDCKTMVDRITNRVGSWTARYLSYAEDGLRLLGKVSACWPKVYGGLGFPDLDLANRVANLKHIWNLLFFKHSRLWSSWVQIPYQDQELLEYKALFSQLWVLEETAED